MIEKYRLHKNSKVKHTIAVMSGKGGVGKSSVTALMAVALMEQGLKVGVMDADITGPSIPKVFGLSGKRARGTETSIYPVQTLKGIKIMSINVLVENDDDPVIWRGPVLSGMIERFYSEVEWGDLDVMLIDMPPGTGDVPLTVMQSVPVDGIVVVSSPQDLVGLIVKKSIKMANMLKTPLLGIVENMAYLECPDCGGKHHIFGESKVGEVAKEHKLPVLATLPIDPKLAALSDEGKVELYGKINYTFGEDFGSKVEKIMADLDKKPFVLPTF